MKINLRQDETLVLRTCNANGTSFGGFRWPKRGPVKCNDWHPYPRCGYGLHGALMGEGDGDLFDWSKFALWQVVKVKKSEIVDLCGKVKFPRGYVFFTGGRKEATDIIYDNGGINVIGAIREAGNNTVVSVGYKGSATVGHNGIAIAKHRGIAVAGNNGTAISENFGKSSAGIYGIAKSGINGISSVGNGGIAIVGYRGLARAGIGGRIEIESYNINNQRRPFVGYIGEDNLNPDIFYRIENGRFTQAHYE